MSGQRINVLEMRKFCKNLQGWQEFCELLNFWSHRDVPVSKEQLPQIWALITIESDTCFHSVLVISRWLLVERCCQRHFLLSSSVIEINRSVHDVDVCHLLKSPEIFFHVLEKIFQAVVFPSYPESWNFLESQKGWRTLLFGLLWE